MINGISQNTTYVLEPLFEGTFEHTRAKSISSIGAKIGVGLQKPFSWSLYHVVQLFLLNSIAAKTSAVFIAIIVFPITALIAGTGTLIWAVFVKSRPPFVFKQGVDVLPPSPLAQRKLKVMTWNVALGPPYMAAVNRISPPAQRIDAIARKIFNQSPDIVCLQEVFDEESEKKLVNLLSDQGYDCVHSIISSKVKLSSGLLIAMRRQQSCSMNVLRAGTWQFKNLTHWDRAANKGLLGLDLQITHNGKTRKLFLFNMHLQADYPGTSFAAQRIQQVRSVARTMKEFIGERSKEDLICACGDLNFARDSGNDEYKKQIHALRHLVYDGNPENSLDYILWSKDKKHNAASYELMPSEQISDHDALISTLDLSN